MLSLGARLSVVYSLPRFQTNAFPERHNFKPERENSAQAHFSLQKIGFPPPKHPTILNCAQSPAIPELVRTHGAGPGRAGADTRLAPHRPIPAQSGFVFFGAIRRLKSRLYVSLSKT